MAENELPFETELQEAEWWTKNQDLIADRFEREKAVANLGKGSVARVARESAEQAGELPIIAIRLAEADLARAKTLAAEKGLPYQTYLKMLIHQALKAEQHNAECR